jgi:hypothetical protein
MFAPFAHELVGRDTTQVLNDAHDPSWKRKDSGILIDKQAAIL